MLLSSSSPALPPPLLPPPHIAGTERQPSTSGLWINQGRCPFTLHPFLSLSVLFCQMGLARKGAPLAQDCKCRAMPVARRAADSRVGIGGGHLVEPSARARRKTQKHLEGFPGGCQSHGGSLGWGEGMLQPLRLYGTHWDSGQTGQLCPQSRICVSWSLAPGGEEQGGSPRQQTNWAKNPRAAPEGGGQREQRAATLLSSFLHGGGWGGVSGLGAAGKSCDSSDPCPGGWVVQERACWR